jgi:hypothetical protein
MKKTLLTLALLATASASFAQGTLQIGNNFTGVLRAPIYGEDPANRFLSVSGQSALGTPAGTTVYNGPLLAGTGYTFALFAGPAGAAESALQLVSTTTFRTGTALPAGTVFTQTLPINGVASGSSAALQVRVWDNVGGTISTWALVLAAPNVARGSSPVFASAPLGGPDPAGGPPITPPAMTGWTSFNVAAVPEPSVIALGALGLGALLLRRRKTS